MKNTTVPEPFLTEEENNERIVHMARENGFIRGFVWGVISATAITVSIIFFV